MKKGKNLLILSALLIVLLGGAGFAYSALRGNAVPEDTAEAPEIPETPAEETASSGELAPDFTFLNADGEEVRLADLTGMPLLINFWATWCPPCREELPYFEKAYAEYGDSVQFLMMNETDGMRDTVESAKKFCEENGYAFPVYFDTQGSGGRAYSVMYIPVTVFISAEGELVYQHVGAMTEEDLFSMLERQMN